METIKFNKKENTNVQNKALNKAIEEAVKKKNIAIKSNKIITK